MNVQPEQLGMMYNTLCYGGYKPIVAGPDDLASLDMFNDWVKPVLNERMHALHLRSNEMEKNLNILARQQSGFYPNYLKKFANAFFRKDFQYNEAERLAFTHSIEWDASGEAYNWYEKWSEDVIVYPVMEALPFGLLDFYPVVYKNGRPLSRERYEVHKEQTMLSLFIPKSETIANDLITIELRKFWAPLDRYSYDVVGTHSNCTFTFDAAKLGDFINSDNGKSKGDYLVYYREYDERQFRLLPDEDYSVVKINDNQLNVAVTRQVNDKSVIMVLNNAAGWYMDFTTSKYSWEDYFPLITDNKTSEEVFNDDPNLSIRKNGNRFVNPFSIESNHYRIPLPVKKAEELLVLVHEPDKMAFKLIPNIDFIIEENLDNDEFPREVKLMRQVPPQTRITIAKMEPMTWFNVFEYRNETHPDGMVVIADSKIPLNTDFLDVSLNNKNVSKKFMENVADKVFRIKEFSNNRYLVVRAFILKNNVIEQVIEDYASYRTDLQTYLDQVEY